jgi:hypothetical protein
VCHAKLFSAHFTESVHLGQCVLFQLPEFSLGLGIEVIFHEPDKYSGLRESAPFLPYLDHASGL